MATRTEWTIEDVAAIRDERYHRASHLNVSSEEEALAFVNEVGLAFLFSDKGAEMPTLWEAVAGHRPKPRTNRDPDVGRVWKWKDTLPARGAIFYGKLLRKKPTLVSLEMLPYFYALSPNYGDLHDYLNQYEAGLMSMEAKNVYEALLDEGALATSRLRQVAGLPGGGSNARRFDRAVTDLQIELKIAKVGISDANRWGYAYVYDLFMRSFPEVPEQARHISTDEAMDTLLMQYLRNVVVQTESGTQRLFRWDDWEWERLMERLVERDLIRRDVRLEGLRGNCLARVEDLESL